MGKRSDVVYQPAAGVYTDFESVLQRFSETDTVRYESFAEIWRDLDMSYFFAGRQHLREVREFIEECYRIALQFWLPPYNFQVRVGGLYLLYGLYQTQPVVHRVRIRVTNTQWQHILAFQSEAYQQQHWDVVFVFQKLRLNNAFDFVATEIEKYPSLRDSTTEDSSIPDEFKEETSILYDLFAADTLEQFSTLHQHYHKMKIGLKGPDATQPSRSLDVINSDLISGVTNAIAHYQDRRRTHSQHAKKIYGLTDSEEDAYKSAGEDEAGRDSSLNTWKQTSKKFRLKAKAFKQVAKAHKSRRHRQATKDQKAKKRKSKKSNMDETSDLTSDLNTSTATEEDEMSEQKADFISMPSFFSFLEDTDESPGKSKGKKRGKKTIEDESATPKKKVKKENQNKTGDDDTTPKKKAKKSKESKESSLSPKKKLKTNEQENSDDLTAPKKKVRKKKQTKGEENTEKSVTSSESDKGSEKLSAEKEGKTKKSTKKRKTPNKKSETNDNTSKESDLMEKGVELDDSLTAGDQSTEKSQKETKKQQPAKKSRKKKEEIKIEIEIVNDEIDNEVNPAVTEENKNRKSAVKKKKISDPPKTAKKGQQKVKSGKGSPSKKKSKACLHVKLSPPKKKKKS